VAICLSSNLCCCNTTCACCDTQVCVVRGARLARSNNLACIPAMLKTGDACDRPAASQRCLLRLTTGHVTEVMCKSSFMVSEQKGRICFAVREDTFTSLQVHLTFTTVYSEALEEALKCNLSFCKLCLVLSSHDTHCFMYNVLVCIRPIAVSVVAGLCPDRHAVLKHTQTGVHMCSAEAWASVLHQTGSCIEYHDAAQMQTRNWLIYIISARFVRHRCSQSKRQRVRQSHRA